MIFNWSRVIEEADIFAFLRSSLNLFSYGDEWRDGLNRTAQEKPPRVGISLEEREQKLRLDMQHYYFEWLSPISRKDQVFENLKLGFYLLFGLALFFMVWGGIALWHNYFVKGLSTFAVLNTVLEAWDFMRSKYFDNPAASQKRARRGKAHEIFPVPHSRGAFLAGWVFNIAVSAVVALWPAVRTFIEKLSCS
jgi:hypothetical protein